MSDAAARQPWIIAFAGDRRRWAWQLEARTFRADGSGECEPGEAAYMAVGFGLRETLHRAASDLDAYPGVSIYGNDRHVARQLRGLEPVTGERAMVLCERCLDLLTELEGLGPLHVDAECRMAAHAEVAAKLERT